MKISDLSTPCLLLDRAILRRNLERMADHVGRLGGVLRPHVKTHKSADVQAELVRAGHCRGITVSTIAEAEYFFGQGENDILYAVGIAPNKLDAIAALRARGADIKIILDSVESARIVAEKGAALGIEYPVLIELDVDGHRAGVEPDSALLLEVAAALSAPGARLLGVMTHAGGSYDCRSEDALKAIAEEERRLAVLAADRLREAGFRVEIVSIGSTPTARYADSLEGVTEVRAGVYTFHDLVMAELGVCEEGDLAVTVLGSVIGHQSAKGWTLTDAGWMAMSRDRGTASHAIDYGYGQVRDLGGRPIGSLIITSANQEHGIIEPRAGGCEGDARLEVGEMIRIAPNHACATAAQFDRYYVIEADRVVAEWPRVRGW